ncbi:protein kinase [Streptomyces sp. NPDC096094]|uniref:protein kinase n=1 Tax=Streptomyces sp. NPDC096094 TaxID=3366073 RepID=UPI003824FEA6
MDDYAGRVLADRYRLPLPPSDEYELTETRAFDTYSGQEVLVRQVPLPEVVEAEVLDADGLPDGFTARDGTGRPPGRRSSAAHGGQRRPADPVVRRAVEAAQAAAAVPDHPRLDQVFDVFAEGGSLWVVSELVAARPLAALLAEQSLTPYRAAEVASDILLALRVLHTYGWVHRNITARTVLVCDDGRVMLTGLAVGAAEEALCGYDPVPAPEDEEGPGSAVAPDGTFGRGGGAATAALGPGGAEGGAGLPGPGGAGVAAVGPGGVGSGLPGPGGAGIAATGPGGAGFGAGDSGMVQTGMLGPGGADPEAARRAAIEARTVGGLPAPGAQGPGGASAGLAPAPPDSGGDARAARAGAIAAYRAGARAAARVQEAQNGRAALPGARPAPDNGTGRPSGAPGTGPVGARPSYAAGPEQAPHALGPGAEPGPPHAAGPGSPSAAARSAYSAGPGTSPGATPSGQIADPYGVRTTSWHGATPRPAGHPAPAAPPASAAGRALPAAPHEEATTAPTGHWDDLAARPPAPRGPATALAAERARQTRMAVVGPVTERWAPEQAGPVHENWQLAAPIGPATDLWALGALLYRAVQGHAPYPEESTAELVQIVCAEPPAFAEECGPLRPVVESLLRQDPTERIDFEELRGWLRSLVRSAPEPEAGLHVVSAPPVETSRLPIVRRRGELVRRRRAGLPAHHGRHKRGKRETARSPRSLGRTLLLLILLALAGAIAYAMFLMPKSDTNGDGTTDRTGAVGEASQAPPERSPDAGSEPRPEETSPEPDPGASETAGGSTETQTNDPDVADGFALRKDPEGFHVAVAEGWNRTPRNGSGQVVYAKGDFELVVVPGRDRASEFGDDPMVYQRDSEPELAPYRASSWATSSGLKTIEVGGRTMAEGQFTWTGAGGGELFVRNAAILIDGRYHVVQVRGPEAERDEVSRLFEQASATYQYTR